MTPIADWRRVLKHAWSVRLMIVAALLSGAEAALPFLDLPIPAGLFAILTLLVTVAAFVARFIVQRSLATPSTEPDWEDGEPK
ncbi:MAG: hypothetical protein EOP24_27620 [Hyphomicrobiales bacterium]|nr:MAG: hypothetical protein EOP24_27620 [Hyphomicrobiales bacterium]